MERKILKIKRQTDTVICLLLQNKEDKTWTYINLTKQHICPCKFKTYEDAIQDLNTRKNKVLEYEFLNNLIIKNNLSIVEEEEKNV
jgi:hypothetical protein